MLCCLVITDKLCTSNHPEKIEEEWRKGGQSILDGEALEEGGGQHFNSQLRISLSNFGRFQEPVAAKYVQYSVM